MSIKNPNLFKYILGNLLILILLLLKEQKVGIIE